VGREEGKVKRGKGRRNKLEESGDSSERNVIDFLCETFCCRFYFSPSSPALSDSERLQKGKKKLIDLNKYNEEKKTTTRESEVWAHI